MRVDILEPSDTCHDVKLEVGARIAGEYLRCNENLPAPCRTMLQRASKEVAAPREAFPAFPPGARCAPMRC